VVLFVFHHLIIDASLMAHDLKTLWCLRLEFCAYWLNKVVVFSIWVLITLVFFLLIVVKTCGFGICISFKVLNYLLLLFCIKIFRNSTMDFSNKNVTFLELQSHTNLQFCFHECNCCKHDSQQQISAKKQEKCKNEKTCKTGNVVETS
jgi:hypothetical protein